MCFIIHDPNEMFPATFGRPAVAGNRHPIGLPPCWKRIDSWLFKELTDGSGANRHQEMHEGPLSSVKCQVNLH
jgi:hypothetical protein